MILLKWKLFKIFLLNWISLSNFILSVQLLTSVQHFVEFKKNKDILHNLLNIICRRIYFSSWLILHKWFLVNKSTHLTLWLWCLPEIRPSIEFRTINLWSKQLMLIKIKTNVFLVISLQRLGLQEQLYYELNPRKDFTYKGSGHGKDRITHDKRQN